MDFNGFKLHTMAGGTNYFQLDDIMDVISQQPEMNPNEPAGVNNGVAIFGQVEDERMDDFFDPIQMLHDTPTETMQQWATSAFPGNPAVDNVSDTAAQVESPMYSFSQQKLVTENSSNICHQEPKQLCLMNHNPQQVIHGHGEEGHGSSSTWPAPAPAQTMTQMQDGTGNQRESDMAAPQPETTEASRAGSSTERRRKRVKKTKEYERKTPYEDERKERKRQNAIKAKEYRIKKKQEEDELRRNISHLQLENSNLTQELMEMRQEISRQKQELTEERQEISRLKQELKEKLQRVSRHTQDLVRHNQWLHEMCQLHQKFDATNQQFNG